MQRPLAQEPLTQRPRVTQTPSSEALSNMLGGLEALLANLPEGPVESPPEAFSEQLSGSFLRDWRSLDDSSQLDERVRRL
jgi:hypothetical protein